MPHPTFDRFAVKMEPLASRPSKKHVERDLLSPEDEPRELSDDARRMIANLAQRIHTAREKNRPVMITYGAHLIKNGLGPILVHLAKEKWVTHLATNGAGIIHDWEFAYQGKSCEDVAMMVERGQFGNWEETGFYINLALNVGAYEGKGYGESVGSMILNEGLTIPSEEQLISDVHNCLSSDPQKSASAADLLSIVRRFELESGWRAIAHPWKRVSAQAGALEAGIALTGHPMIGHDIIYNHPMNHGASLGRAAERDFLTFAESVSRLEDGIYVSIGSAVMSPMVFEKSLSMSQNLAIQRGEHIDRHFIFINDLAESTWDWSKGEPPEDNPAYYLRYNKSFSRMGGTMCYLQADNRDFLLTLIREL